MKPRAKSEIYDVLSDDSILDTVCPRELEIDEDEEIVAHILRNLEEPQVQELVLEHPSIVRTLFGYAVFCLQFLMTSAVIFLFLLVTTNYSAYITLARSYLLPGELSAGSESILNSIQASSLIFKEREEFVKEQQETTANLQKERSQQHSIKQLMTMANKEDKPMSVEITPFSNRIVIPKIAKNIPLLDIQKKTVQDHDELQDIFMEELQKGVIRYPGSAKPGQEGTTFIFGHSSNFPWIKGDYNDVFALLDKVVFDDIIIVYYNQKKYTFKIREKKVILP